MTQRKNINNWRGVLILIIAGFFVISGSKVAAEVIREFDADVKLNTDCSLDVIEIIKMDFENSRRHGIFRIIPVSYSRYGGNYHLVFHLLGVTDEANRPINYTENSMGSDVNIKIGDIDHMLTGQHTYYIHYSVLRAVNFFDKEPEVYWNGTGNDWPFAIEKADIRFHPPEGINLSDIKTACYIGPTGSRMPGETQKRDKYIEFTTTNLSPGSGLTMVARLPAGSLIKPSFWQEIFWFLWDWWGLIVIPAITALWVGSILLPRISDPDGHHAIAVEWNPPKDLSPAEVGTLIDESCDMQDIVSTLVDLAARGYLQICEIEAPTFLFFSNKDYEFKKMSANRSDEIPRFLSTFLFCIIWCAKAARDLLHGLAWRQLRV